MIEKWLVDQELLDVSTYLQSPKFFIGSKVCCWNWRAGGLLQDLFKPRIFKSMLLPQAGNEFSY